MWIPVVCGIPRGHRVSTLWAAGAGYSPDQGEQNNQLHSKYFWKIIVLYFYIILEKVPSIARVTLKTTEKNWILSETNF